MSCSYKGTMPVGKGYGVATGNGGEKLFGNKAAGPNRKLVVTKKKTKKSTSMTFTKK